MSDSKGNREVVGSVAMGPGTRLVPPVKFSIKEGAGDASALRALSEKIDCAFREIDRGIARVHALCTDLHETQQSLIDKQTPPTKKAKRSGATTTL